MEKTQNLKGIKSKQFIFILALFVSVLSGYAQSGEMANKTAEEKARLITDKQMEKINFSGDQEEQMYTINLKYVKEMEVITKEGRSMETLRKLQDMSDRKDKEVKTVLEKDQYKLYIKQKKEMRSQIMDNQRFGR